MTPQAQPARHWWRLAGLAWGAVNLAALAGGLFPRLITLGASAESSAELPTLQSLLACQVGFLLLIYPMILAGRAAREYPRASLGRLLRHFFLEMILWLVVALPFLVVAAYLANATPRDAGRSMLLVVGAFLAAWGLALLAGRGAGGMSLSVLVSVLAVLGLPAAWYLTSPDFLPAQPGWLWDLAPTLFAWSTAHERIASWLPVPLWALILWPAIGLAMIFLHLIRPPADQARQ